MAQPFSPCHFSPLAEIPGSIELLENSLTYEGVEWRKIIECSTDTSELLLHSFNTPERKDREHDSHGGVMIYVKDCLHYKRRVDLESRNIESIWIELTNNHKRILFGLFYRPPNSDSNYFSDIEDSVALAVESPGISEIIITGDFNLNVLHPQTARKINSICTEFSF